MIPSVLCDLCVPSRPTRPSRQLVSRCLFAALVLLATTTAHAEVILQYFNTPWPEITAKVPELAEAGYTALWLPPPTKASNPGSVGYDVFDAFDLGSEDQRGSIATHYGTEAQLLQLVATAHRFGLRVYFDTIMNHRAFEVPTASNPGLYPGLVAADFHLQTQPDGSFKRWDNTRSWADAWQVQNLGLAGLLDLAQEPGATNQNYGAHEGDTAPKPKFIRDPQHPERYCYKPDGSYVGFGPSNGITTEMLRANEPFYAEYVQDYLCRAARWLVDKTHADGLRLDAVKHVPAAFFCTTSGDDKDRSDAGYCGQIQRQFNLTHGFTDANHRDSLFDAERPRDDALIFGEHLGNAPPFADYIDAGMRLLDNPLREALNTRLGNAEQTLEGYDQAGSGGFSAGTGIMHAQSHDNDDARHRELQHALYLLRAGIGLIYTDGNHHAPQFGASGGAFPRHANTAYLGQFKDPRLPNLLSIHEQFARGDQVGQWSDNDVLVWERIDKRENPSMSDASGVTLLVMLNDNFTSGQARTFATSFASSDYLYNYSTYGGGFYKYASELPSVVIPPGGYFAFSLKNPDPSTLWQKAGGQTITITQGDATVGVVAVTRRDGESGDAAFNGNALPSTTSPSLPPDKVTDDHQYTALIPRITDTHSIRFTARVDGSAETVMFKLDGGVGLSASAESPHAKAQSRKDSESTIHSDLRVSAPPREPSPPLTNPPGQATDTFLGYEPGEFVSRIHPELFAAMDTGLHNVTGSQEPRPSPPAASPSQARKTASSSMAAPPPFYTTILARPSATSSPRARNSMPQNTRCGPRPTTSATATKCTSTTCPMAATNPSEPQASRSPAPRSSK